MAQYRGALGDCVGRVSLPPDLADLSPGIPEFVDVGGCAGQIDYGNSPDDPYDLVDEDPVFYMTIDGIDETFCVKEA